MMSAITTEGTGLRAQPAQLACLYAWLHLESNPFITAPKLLLNSPNLRGAQAIPEGEYRVTQTALTLHHVFKHPKPHQILGGLDVVQSMTKVR